MSVHAWRPSSRNLLQTRYDNAKLLLWNCKQNNWVDLTCADNEQGSNLKFYRKIQNRSSAYTDLVKTRGMIRCHVQVIIPCWPLSSFSSKLRTVLEICWSLGGSIPLAKFVGINQKTNCRFTKKLGYQKLLYLMNIHLDLSRAESRIRTQITRVRNEQSWYGLNWCKFARFEVLRSWREQSFYR